MPLGFTFTGDSLSPSYSGPANSGLGISIQGITTGGFSSGGNSIPLSASQAPAGSSGFGTSMSPELLLLAALAVLAVMVLRRK